MKVSVVLKVLVVLTCLSFCFWAWWAWTEGHPNHQPTGNPCEGNLMLIQQAFRYSKSNKDHYPANLEQVADELIKIGYISDREHLYSMLRSKIVRKRHGLLGVDYIVEDGPPYDCLFEGYKYPVIMDKQGVHEGGRHLLIPDQVLRFYREEQISSVLRQNKVVADDQK